MTPAVRTARRLGLEFELLHYDSDATMESWGEAAAEALGHDPMEVFKTLVAMLEPGGAVVALVPVCRRLDLKGLAAVCGAKRAALASADVAERLTGYVTGGISPLGQRRRLPTVVDDSARQHRTILVSAGRRGLELGLAPDELVRALDARYGAISRPRRATGGAGGDRRGGPGTG